MILWIRTGLKTFFLTATRDRLEAVLARMGTPAP